MQAQTEAGVSGTVIDQAGKAVPDAAVVLRSGSNFERALTTDAQGRFSAAGVPVGSYTVEVKAPGFNAGRREFQVTAGATQELSISLNVGSLAQTVTVEAVASVAAQLAPSGNTLDAVSAKTEISAAYIQQFTSPVSDFSEVLNMAPGTFAVNSNGTGLGQAKTFFRGFKDGQYTISFDGIPFQDTNDPTHHSWAFFPGQWLGGTEFDRSPGSASTVGPENFGGSINLLSHEVPSSQNARATVAYGSFDTSLLALDYDTGQFGGKAKKSSLSLDLHQLRSEGYQTYNYQKRVGGQMKYQYKLNDRTTVTAFFGLLDLWNNTPDTNQPSRAQIAQFGDNFLLNGDPASPFYYGYSFYHIQTNFGYIGIKSDLGHGWLLENKTFTYRYWNKQNLEKDLTKLTATSAVDKLNGAIHVGDVVSVSKSVRWGVFRTGVWYDWAYTDRYQYPSSPFTWANSATPLFHEHFITRTAQPFGEFEWHATPRLSITAGIKEAHYGLEFNQFQDNGKAVGCLGGVLDKNKNCIGGSVSVRHSESYNSWLPAISARYRLRRNWSAYAQFAEGSVIPPTSVFDVANGAVETPPKPTLAKTYQIGSVWKHNRVTLDADAYYIHFQNPYTAINDPANQNEPVYYPTGPSNTKGIEAESNVLFGYGVSLYLNGTMGAAKYENTGLWVANAPRNTATFGLTWQHSNFDMGFFNKHIGRMYNDNASVNQAVKIDPFYLTNLNMNYTIKNASFLRGSKLGLAFNNLFDQHSIVGVAPATAPTAAVPFAPAGGDLLTLLPGRSVMLTLTVGLAPRR
jgi:iron complex outermembrane receptor protein